MRNIKKPTLAFILVLAACGGSSEEGSPTTSPTSAEATETSGATSGDSTTVAGADDDGDDDIARGEAVAVVTIGDDTYEFLLSGKSTVDGTIYSGQCISGNGFSGRGYSADGRHIIINFAIPPEDWETNDPSGIWEPPEIIVRGVGDWEANVEFSKNDTVGTGNSQVDSYTIDETTVTGTATYWDTLSSGPDSVPRSGPFEITCL